MVRKSKIVAGLKDAVRYARGDLEPGIKYRVEIACSELRGQSRARHRTLPRRLEPRGRTRRV